MHAKAINQDAMRQTTTVSRRGDEGTGGILQSRKTGRMKELMTKFGRRDEAEAFSMLTV